MESEREKERVRKNLLKQADMAGVVKQISDAVEKELSKIENSTPGGYVDYGNADDFVDILRLSKPEIPEDPSDVESEPSDDGGDEVWEPYDHLMPHTSSSSSSSSSALNTKVYGSPFRGQGDKKMDLAEEFMIHQVKVCQDSVNVESNELLDERGFATFKTLCHLNTDQHFLVLNANDQFMILTRQKVSSTMTECKVVAKSDEYGKTVNGVLLGNKTLVRFLDLVGLKTLKEVSDNGCLQWCNEVEHRRFETRLKLLLEEGKILSESSSSSWRHVIGTPQGSSRGGDFQIGNKFKETPEVAKATVKLQGLQRPISVQMPMSSGLNYISRDPTLAMNQDSYQVQSNLALDTSNGHTIGNFHILQACQIVGAVGDVYKFWPWLCNLTSPGPYSRRDADQIYQHHQHIGATELDVSDPVLKRLMIVTAEENIGAHADRLSQLFKNIISLFDAAYVFTESTWDALQAYRGRLEEYLSRHEFGAPNGKFTELMYLKAIYVYSIDMTMMIRAVLSNKKILGEQAWLSVVANLPKLDVGSELWDYHQQLSINVSVASVANIIKKPKVVKKPKAEVNDVEDKQPPKKVIKDRKVKGGKGICYNNLTSDGCQYGDKCKFNHVDPKPSEYGAVKQFLDLKSLVARDGLKLE